MKGIYFGIAALIVAATLLGTIAVYPDLPNRIPIHWNVHGQINAYRGKAFAFVIPAVMAGIILLFAALPWLSPQKYEVDSFRGAYLFMMVVILSFLGYVHLLTLRAALSKPIDMNRAILGAMFILFVALGGVLDKVQRNFYIGIRTPWTLANEKVWTATHRFSAKAFVIAGVLGLICVALIPKVAVEVAILIATAVVSVLYSLVYYKRLERRHEL